MRSTEEQHQQLNSPVRIPTPSSSSRRSLHVSSSSSEGMERSLLLMEFRDGRAEGEFLAFARTEATMRTAVAVCVAQCLGNCVGGLSMEEAGWVRWAYHSVAFLLLAVALLVYFLCLRTAGTRKDGDEEEEEEADDEARGVEWGERGEAVRARLFDALCVGYLAVGLLSALTEYPYSSECYKFYTGSPRAMAHHEAVDKCYGAVFSQIFVFPLVASVLLTAPRVKFGVPLLLLSPIFAVVSRILTEAEDSRRTMWAKFALCFSITAVFAAALAVAEWASRKDFVVRVAAARAEATAKRSARMSHKVIGNFLPALEAARTVAPFDCCCSGSIGICDACNFELWQLSVPQPKVVVGAVNALHDMFDGLRAEKVNTFGDQYIFTFGLRGKCNGPAPSAPASLAAGFRKISFSHSGGRDVKEEDCGSGECNNKKVIAATVLQDTTSKRSSQCSNNEPQMCAMRAVIVALRMKKCQSQLNATFNFQSPLQLRVAVHSGPLFGGIVGSNSLVYDVFGPTAKVVARAVRQCPGGQILVSSNTAKLLNISNHDGCDPPSGLAGLELRAAVAPSGTQQRDGCAAFQQPLPAAMEEQVTGEEDATPTSFFFVHSHPPLEELDQWNPAAEISESEGEKRWRPHLGQQQPQPQPGLRRLSSAEELTAIFSGGNDHNSRRQIVDSSSHIGAEGGTLARKFVVEKLEAIGELFPETSTQVADRELIEHQERERKEGGWWWWWTPGRIPSGGAAEVCANKFLAKYERVISSAGNVQLAATLAFIGAASLIDEMEEAEGEEGIKKWGPAAALGASAGLSLLHAALRRAVDLPTYFNLIFPCLLMVVAYCSLFFVMGDCIVNRGVLYVGFVLCSILYLLLLRATWSLAALLMVVCVVAPEAAAAVYKGTNMTTTVSYCLLRTIVVTFVLWQRDAALKETIMAAVHQLGLKTSALNEAQICRWFLGTVIPPAIVPLVLQLHRNHDEEKKNKGKQSKKQLHYFFSRDAVGRKIGGEAINASSSSVFLDREEKSFLREIENVVVLRCEFDFSHCYGCNTSDRSRCSASAVVRCLEVARAGVESAVATNVYLHLVGGAIGDTVVLAGPLADAAASYEETTTTNAAAAHTDNNNSNNTANYLNLKQSSWGSSSSSRRTGRGSSAAVVAGSEASGDALPLMAVVKQRQKEKRSAAGTRRRSGGHHQYRNKQEQPETGEGVTSIDVATTVAAASSTIMFSNPLVLPSANPAEEVEQGEGEEEEAVASSAAVAFREAEFAGGGERRALVAATVEETLRTMMVLHFLFSSSPSTAGARHSPSTSSEGVWVEKAAASAATHPKMEEAGAAEGGAGCCLAMVACVGGAIGAFFGLPSMNFGLMGSAPTTAANILDAVTATAANNNSNNNNDDDDDGNGSNAQWRGSNFAGVSRSFRTAMELLGVAVQSTAWVISAPVAVKLRPTLQPAESNNGNTCGIDDRGDEIITLFPLVFQPAQFSSSLGASCSPTCLSTPVGAH